MKVRTLAQRLLFNTLRLEGYSADGKLVGVGTGFVLAHDLPGYGKELFLVTNKHVLEGVHRVTLYVHRLKDDAPDFGNHFFLNIENVRSTYWGHPTPDVDIVVMPISWWFEMVGRDGTKAFLTELTTEIVISPSEAESLDVVEPVLFVGYPNGIYDTTNYLPVFRQGTTASPYQLDYDGQPAFLIDASVFGGSSGSPVFRGIPTIGGQALAAYQLLGVLTGVFFRTEEGSIELQPAPTNAVPVAVTREMLDLGFVFKAHLIREAIDSWWKEHEGRKDALLAWKRGLTQAPPAKPTA